MPAGAIDKQAADRSSAWRDGERQPDPVQATALGPTVTTMFPTLLVPGPLCSAGAFAAQAMVLRAFGPVTIASTLAGKTIGEIASAILHGAPPRFALAGISIGRSICMEIMRQASDRVLKLALLGTSAHPDHSRSGTPAETTGSHMTQGR